LEETEQRILDVRIEEEMQSSYMDYAMSVIVGRALPDARDGLKPVHRRVLYSMSETGMRHDKPHKKSARIVGDVLGKYHPHGDTAIYDTIVRMAQDFSLRYPLVDGHGNFGSLDGDGAAAMRYTEIRLARVADEVLADLEKDTVDFQPNFDDSLKEPVVLPSRLPNLLVNGSSGIAVGMSTNIPPHNLSEVCDAAVHLLDNPEATGEDLMQFVLGPDFPTGGIISGNRGIQNAYLTGRGLISVRGSVHLEEDKKRKRLVITEIPYQVNKSKLTEDIASLVRDKQLDGVTDLRDESDRDGVRIVVELRRDANEEIIQNHIFKRTQLSTTFGIIMLALWEGQPRLLTLSNALSHFLEFRVEVITRRTKYELAKAERRLHVVEGLLVAIERLDDVIALIRAAEDRETAASSLQDKFGLSAEQAKAILEMQLRQLTGLELRKLEEEHKTLVETIARLTRILEDRREIDALIKQELAEIKQRYGDERRTQIVEEEVAIDEEDLIAEEDMVISITQDGYVKRTPLATYRTQKRGGIGVIGMGTKAEDYITDMFVASTHDYLLIFTNQGRVYWQKVYQLPAGSRQARGRSMVNLVGALAEESVTTVIPVREFAEDRYLLMATRGGKVKKTSLSEYSRPRTTGIIGCGLGEGDELIGVKSTDGNTDIVLATRLGKAIRFSESEVRPMGRSARGVKGIGLRDGDSVIALDLVTTGGQLLTVTEKGFGKRTAFTDYPSQGRGGMGVINVRIEKSGPSVAVHAVEDEDDVIVVTHEGIVMRTSVQDIPVMGRDTMGVIVQRPREGDSVVTVAKIAREQNGNDE